MKFLSPIIISVLVLSSCSNPYWLNTKSYQTLHEDLATVWPKVAVASHSYFICDPLYQSPDQFEAAGGGECVGFAVDLIYHLGPEASFVVCTTSFLSAGQKHAIVQYHGRYLEPQINGDYYALGDGVLLSVDYTLSYYAIMAYVTASGTKGLDSDPLRDFKFGTQAVVKQSAN